MKTAISMIFMVCLFNAAVAQTSFDDQIVKSIEFRNYTLLPGMRDKFSSYMDRIIIPRQRELGGYLMNAFSLNKADDHYIWIRGFADMQSRSKFMKDFYYSDYWRKNAAECNSMLLDSYEVHLLKPVQLKGQETDSLNGIKLSAFKKPTGITVATHYVTQGKRNELIGLLAREYLAVLKKSGFEILALLISETRENDYLPQHVYQDKNLVLMITHFKDVKEYEASLKRLAAITSDNVKKQLTELLVSSDTQILYPLEH